MKDLKLTKLLYFIAGAFILLSACKKKTDDIILPDQTNNNPVEPISSDTFSLFTSTIREDTVSTDLLPYKLLGAMNDPEFGLSKSDFYTQFNITELNAAFNNPGNTLDSAVLTVRFTSKIAYYGNLNAAQSFTVHEVSEDFPAGNNAVFSDKTLSYFPSAIGIFNGSISLNDSIDVRDNDKTVTISGALRIPLTSAFGNKLLTAPANTYTSDKNFKEFFKGIVIRASSNPSAGDGAIFALTPADAYSKLTVYYNDTQQYNFNMRGSKAFANYRILNQPASITNQKSNSNADYNKVYLQSLTGAKVKVTIPYLSNLKIDNGMVIHKAELIVNPLANSFNSTYPLPQRLLVLQPDTFNRSIAIPDLFSGRFNGSLTSNNNYVLNVTDFVQFQINKIKSGEKVSNVLHLVIPTSDPIAPSRLIVDAQKSNPAMIKLKITYTKL